MPGIGNFMTASSNTLQDVSYPGRWARVFYPTRLPGAKLTARPTPSSTLKKRVGIVLAPHTRNRHKEPEGASAPSEGEPETVPKEAIFKILLPA